MDFLTQLTTATAGLTFQSETDAPLEPINIAGDVDAATVLKAGSYPADAKVKPVSLQAFFKDATTVETWNNDDEKAIAQRFQDLVKLLQTNLQGTKVFKVSTSDTEQDVYVIGHLADGQIAGVKTKVVATGD